VDVLLVAQPPQDRTRAVDQQRSQVGITTLA
jgi:hypothetical protein